MGEVVKIFQSDNLGEHGEDILGRIYEYFLGNFFLKRGQKGGEFYLQDLLLDWLHCL